MSYFTESLAQLFGREPRRPAEEEISPKVREIHIEKRANKITLAELEAERQAHRAEGEASKWKKRRWATLIAVNLLFVASYYFDVQLLEGALTASRFVGFHMADLNAALQVMLAYKHVVLNLVIGTVTVLVLWLLLGGRTFCSWVCPYHLLSEWAEKIHLWLVSKEIIEEHTFHRGVRTIFYVVFALLALLTGYTVFETISPTGILSRALIYGPGLALLWVLALLLFEVFVSRRAWCRYVCPIGMTYGLVGSVSPVRVVYSPEKCLFGGDCRTVCMVPHVLDATIMGRAKDESVPIGADCTRCGMCVDICPASALKFEVKGLSKVL
ncbi:MAG: NapH/MauN family ferredoxin-type protein [Pseudomonadota bacterium]|nr:NapH/MauN family ferredoxin-type protein [Pseudomonadota bacterium]